jgi:ferrous iron transport protein B
VSQVLELDQPAVVALNMVDVARDKGLQIDVGGLRAKLNVPVVAIQANRKIGVCDLQAAIIEATESTPGSRPSPLPDLFRQEVAGLEALWSAGGSVRPPRYLVERLLLDSSGYLANAGLPGVNQQLLGAVSAARSRLDAAGLPVPGIEAIARYEWATDVTRQVTRRTPRMEKTWSERIDQVLTHRFWGTAAFALVMMLLFQSVFYVAEPASALIDYLNHLAGEFVAASMAEGAMRSLLMNGVIEGVGGILIFLPQILVLFLFIAALEDCGYMARAAFLMDRLMLRFGLSGKSFIPLLSSFACAIPGIMSARVIENRNDRLLTILLAPLMSCSARLPVYTLLIGAFIPDSRYFGGLIGLRGMTMFALYLLGILASMAVAMVFRRTILRGDSPPFLMELPAYKWPSTGVVLHRMYERGWDFVQRAGTLILAVTIVVWAAAYYPRDPKQLDVQLVARKSLLKSQIADASRASDPGSAEQLASLRESLSHVESAVESAYLRHSYLGRLGRLIEPAVKPLGWDWRMGCAVLASFPAREVVIATLAVIYNLGDDEANRSETLRATLQAATWEGRSDRVFNTPVALSVMVFFALCAQCASTLIVMRRETNSWRWPLLTFCYMTALAYLGAMVTYQVSMLFVGRGGAG